MPQINLVVLLVDRDNNFVTIKDKTNTFLSIKINESLTSTERIDVIVKLLKEKIDLKINKSRLVELEESAVEKSLDDITFVYMYKLDDDEKAKLLPIKIISFYYVNSLPILDIFSSSVARLITSNYILYLTRVPNPPSIIYTYPPNIIVYSPLLSAPVLVPSVTKKDAPIVKRVGKTLNSEVKSDLRTSVKRSSKRSTKRSSSKRSSSKRSSSKRSSSRRRRVSSPRARRVSSPRSRRVSSPRARRVSSPRSRRVSSARSKRVSSLKSRRDLSKRRTGGEYYEKYMKYKTKYIELKRQKGGAKIGDQIQLNDKSFHKIVGQDEKYWILSNDQKIYKNMENITWFNNTIPNRMIAETYINNNKRSESDIDG